MLIHLITFSPFSGVINTFSVNINICQGHLQYHTLPNVSPLELEFQVEDQT